MLDSSIPAMTAKYRIEIVYIAKSKTVTIEKVKLFSYHPNRFRI